MLYQDSLTGMLHEVPDSQVYGLGLAEDPYSVGESQVVYDGLGNPVGALPFLAAALPALSSFLPAIGGLVSKALPAVSSMFGPAGQALQQIPGVGQALAPILGGGGQVPSPSALIGGMAARFPGFPSPFRPPSPLGWIRPQLPYTGLGPRRLYMRCAVWPGPRGLVPAIAAQAPAAPAQAAAAAAAQTAAMMGRRRRRRRR